jgi:hypothetical protein
VTGEVGSWPDGSRGRPQLRRRLNSNDGARQTFELVREYLRFSMMTVNERRRVFHAEQENIFLGISKPLLEERYQ